MPLKHSVAADSWQGKVVGFVGATVLDIVNPDEQVIRVKLYAIKVPGQGRPGAEDAQKRVVSWCHQWGDVAEVQSMGQGPDGQILARVIVGQVDLANVLTKACLASVDVATCRKRGTMECAFWYAWELQCRDEKKGLWTE